MVDDRKPQHDEPMVVTIFETYGAGAETISPRVAESLGSPFHTQAFSSEELEQAEVDRTLVEPVLGRVVSAMGDSPVLSLGYGTNPGPDIPMGQGEVILGRNATYILNKRPATLHVKLDRPVRERIRLAADASGIDIGRAAQRHKREDALRAEMSLRFYGWDPRDLDRYDLVVNTGSLDTDTCATVIVAAASGQGRRGRVSG